jgi:hypothetical protein
MRLVDEVGTDLDGLAQLRALIASGRKPGILVALDFDFIEVEAGRAVFAGTPGDHAYNPIGSLHGGYAATLLDSACVRGRITRNSERGPAGLAEGWREHPFRSLIAILAGDRNWIALCGTHGNVRK